MKLGSKIAACIMLLSFSLPGYAAMFMMNSFGSNGSPKLELSKRLRKDSTGFFNSFASDAGIGASVINLYKVCVFNSGPPHACLTLIGQSGYPGWTFDLSNETTNIFTISRPGNFTLQYYRIIGQQNPPHLQIICGVPPTSVLCKLHPTSGGYAYLIVTVGVWSSGVMKMHYYRSNSSWDNGPSGVKATCVPESTAFGPCT